MEACSVCVCNLWCKVLDDAVQDRGLRPEVEVPVAADELASMTPLVSSLQLCCMLSLNVPSMQNQCIFGTVFDTISGI